MFLSLVEKMLFVLGATSLSILLVIVAETLVSYYGPLGYLVALPGLLFFASAAVFYSKKL